MQRKQSLHSGTTKAKHGRLCQLLKPAVSASFQCASWRLPCRAVQEAILQACRSLLPVGLPRTIMAHVLCARGSAEQLTLFAVHLAHYGCVGVCAGKQGPVLPLRS